MSQTDPRKIIDKVRDDYNLIAREWDLSRNRPSQLKLNLMRGIDADTVVLDLGCGNGAMFPYIAEKGAFYSGLDISKRLIEIARARYSREIKEGKAAFVVGEALELPFRDEEFDFVISFAVLHHIPSEQFRKKFFDEIFRVLRPNGKVKITVWNLLNDWARERFEIGAQLAGKTSGAVQVPWKGTKGKIVNRYVHQFSVEELRALAESGGFSDIRVECFNRAGERTENGEELVLEMSK